MRILIFLLCGILLGGCVSGVKNNELAAKFAKPVIKVGVEPDFPPLIFTQNGKIIGIESEFAKRISEMLGAELILVHTPWNELIPALNRNEFDVIMSGMTITPERAKLVKFTDPYIRVGQMAIMRTADITQFSTPEKVLATDKKIGFINGTTGEAFVREKCTKASKVGFINVQDAKNAILNGKIDVFVSDAPVIWVISDTALTPLCVPLTEEYLAWAVKPDNAKLAEILNKCLAIMKKDGLVEKVNSSWIPELIRKKIY